MAIEIVGTTAPKVEEGDTLALAARGVSAGGDVVPDAAIIWQVLDTGSVGFTLDSTTGQIVGQTPGTWRVRAVLDDLHSGAVSVMVTPAPDSLAASAAARDTVPSTATQSVPLTVTLYDLTTAPSQQLPLAGKWVHFGVVDPAPGTAEADGVVLAIQDSVPADDPRGAAVLTTSGGQASVVARRTTVAAPDSAVIEATATTAAGMTVAGSPVRFVVVFLAP